MIRIGNIELPDFPLLLAPMEDVSDPPFRAVCKDNGADLMFSEFISSEGLIRDAMKSKMKLDFSEEERPFGIQIFGGDEEAMALSAKICEAVNPDLVDPEFDLLKPEAILYAPGPGGQLRLVALEYIVVNVGQPRPMFGNQPFDIGGTPLPVPHWSLHVWLYENNPSGIFKPFNPNVSCP